MTLSDTHSQNAAARLYLPLHVHAAVTNVGDFLGVDDDDVIYVGYSEKKSRMPRLSNLKRTLESGVWLWRCSICGLRSCHVRNEVSGARFAKLKML